MVASDCEEDLYTRMSCLAPKGWTCVPPIAEAPYPSGIPRLASATADQASEAWRVARVHS